MRAAIISGVSPVGGTRFGSAPAASNAPGANGEAGTLIMYQNTFPGFQLEPDHNVRTLAHTPDVLLLDEPTANLDAVNIERVERLIAAYLTTHRACCIWVSHDRAQLERVASSLLILDAHGQPCDAPCS